MSIIKRNTHRFHLLHSLILLFFAASISAQTVTLKIIETTDEHGEAFPYNFTDKKDLNHSLAQVTTYLKQERANKDQETILLSGGDLLQGTPLVYYYNFEKPEVPHIFAGVMNYMGYDAGTVGNHDIETGHNVYDRFNKEINFPWLAANALNAETKEPYFKPYTVIIRKGIKIAVLGMITPWIPNWLPKNIWSGMEFQDMIECAKKWVKIIKEKEKPDLLIGLFHSGVDYTYGNQTAETYKNENASRLVAERVPGFDLIFAGHDHHGWNFNVISSEGNSVLLLGGINGARTAAAAKVTLTFDASTSSWNKKTEGMIVEIKNYKPDPEFLSKFQYAFDEVKRYVERPLGTFTEPISTRESIFGNSSFTDLIEKIQLELTGADISFTSPLSFDIGIEKGVISVGNMFDLYRYENLLYTIEMTGLEIKNYLEFSSSLWFNQMNGPDDHLINFSRNEEGDIIFDSKNGLPLLKGVYYNFDSAAGINYTLDVSKAAGSRIKISTTFSGEAFDLNKKYKVAVNSYRGNGGGNLLTQGAHIPKEELEKRIIASTDKDLRYYMMKWIEQKKSVAPAAYNNWKIIPEEWWRRGKEKDFKLLFK
jgi:2',3'-cyclic-nucleotide 2'-phosphodiesterase / 3'-nucleotidase